VPRAPRPLWTCPKCGARLITKNLWHSCGRFTLEALFARSDPAVIKLARRFLDILRALGDVQIIPQKTRLVCVARVRFAGLTPRKNHFVANFALHRWLKSSRVTRKQDYGPKWRAHFIPIRSVEDLDEELKAWLQESHDLVGVQDRRAKRARRAAPGRDD
jgi:hypothetical protein